MKKKQCDCETCTTHGCKCASYAQFFSILGNQNRLHIIQALKKEPKTVSAIIKATGLEQTCVSHCLGLLERNGFVKVKRDGKYRIYSLNATTVLPLLSLIDTHIGTHDMGGRA